MKKSKCMNCGNIQEFDESGINGYCNKCGSEDLQNYFLLKSVKCFLHDGDYFHTRINGTIKEIERYYLNNWFNFGTDRS
jgi:uncharacterized protein (DUF983 family)